MIKKTGKKITRKAPVRRAALASKTSVKKKVASSLRASASSAQPNEAFYPYRIALHGDMATHLKRFESNLKKFDEEHQTLIQRAFEFAKERHSAQIRADGSLFIIHPLRIANILIGEWKTLDAEVVAAGLLHDVVEDTQTTAREIKESFGDGIGRLIDGMTMWKGSETADVYLQRIARGPERLRIVKCADALDNLRSWHECPEEVSDKFPRWWRQTKEFVLPIARQTCKPAATLLADMLEDPWYLKRARMI